jgi:hypothetical protein
MDSEEVKCLKGWGKLYFYRPWWWSISPSIIYMDNRVVRSIPNSGRHSLPQLVQRTWQIIQCGIRMNAKLQQSWEPHYSGLLHCEQWQLLTDTLWQPIAPILEYSFLDSWTLKLGPKSLPRTLVRNYHFSLHNSPEEHSSCILHGGSLKFNNLLCLTA